MDTKAGSGLLITRTKAALKGRRSAAQVRDESSNQRPQKASAGSLPRTLCVLPHPMEINEEEK